MRSAAALAALVTLGTAVAWFSAKFPGQSIIEADPQSSPTEFVNREVVSPPNLNETQPEFEANETPDETAEASSEKHAQLPIEIAQTSTSSSELNQIDLENLAITVAPSVFLVKVFDSSGTMIGQGTGFSVTPNGLLATNHHVISKGNSYSLVTSQGATFDNAEVIIGDPDADLALLRFEAKDLPYLSLAKSSNVPIGKRVAVFGSPQGLAGSLSEGIVSASGRNLSESFPDDKLPNSGFLIQTTAPISPGSSGSPLLNNSGEVIGVMTLSIQRESQSLNFAVPVEALNSLLEQAKGSWTSASKRKVGIGNNKNYSGSSLDEVVQSDPLFRRLRRLMIVGDWVESLKVANALAEKYPQSSAAHYQCGYCAGMLNLDHESEISFTKVIKIDSKNHFAWCNLGLALYRQEQFQAGLLAFEKAVALQPDFSAAWDNIVRSNALLGNWSKATKALNTLIEIDSKAAEKCARSLLDQNISHLEFRQALERAVASTSDKSGTGRHREYTVAGVAPGDLLAIRSGPGANFSKILSIPNGTKVFVVGNRRFNGTTEWVPVQYGNLRGWVATRYLKQVYGSYEARKKVRVSNPALNDADARKRYLEYLRKLRDEQYQKN